MKRGIVLCALGLGLLAQDAARAAPATTAPSSPALTLATLDRRLADLEAEETRDKREIDDLGGKLADAHTRSLSRGRQFYRLTRAGMLPVGGGFDALVTHAFKVERARRALASELVLERSLRKQGGDLSRRLEQIARERVALGTERQSLDQQQKVVEEDSRRQVAFDRAFATSARAPANDYVAIYGGGAGTDGAGSGFAQARGRLLFPLAGRAEVRPARREGTDGPGLEIRASLGAPVRAVYAGRVAFADRYGPYGRLVILDHGDHYYTVCGNLAGIDVKVGDDVSAGERIGTVGDEGKGPVLYFEVRHGTDTVPPSPWLGI